jgi:hypothetical protein
VWFGGAQLDKSTIGWYLKPFMLQKWYAITKSLGTRGLRENTKVLWTCRHELESSFGSNIWKIWNRFVVYYKNNFFSTFLTLVDIVLLYGIIWYERFGRDQPRTLINQQVASICWSAIFWMALVEVPLIIRFWINKPFNETVCKVQMILNQVILVFC